MSTLNCRMQIASRVTAVSKYLEPNLCLEASTTEGAEEGLRLSTPPPADPANPDSWRGRNKLAVVIESAAVNEQALSERDRRKGLHPEQTRRTSGGARPGEMAQMWRLGRGGGLWRDGR